MLNREFLKKYSNSIPAPNDLMLFEAHEMVDTFLSDTCQKKVLLLLGDALSGKSTYCYQLYHELWQTSSELKPIIPLYIRLAELSNPSERLIEESLEKQSLIHEQIEELKNAARFVVIIDGYDEWDKLQNLYVSNRLAQWDAKVIITCRTFYLAQHSEYASYFMPYINERPQRHLFQELRLEPLSDKIVESYVQQHQLGSIFPFLKDFIRHPFFLNTVVKELPFWISQYEKTGDLEGLKQDCYNTLLQRWFEAQEAKFKALNQLPQETSLVPLFFEYAK